MADRQPELSRRALLALGASVLVGACTSDDDGDGSARSGTAPTASAPRPSPAPPTESSPGTEPRVVTTEPVPSTTALDADPFLLGVASGDPDTTSVVLWTRLTGAGLPDSVEVTWELADDESFGGDVTSGTVTARAAHGHSVHVAVEVDGPAAYRFRAGGFTSAVGRAAPARPGASLKVASASCQHWETGFYAAHRDLVSWAPDAVVFLGDFIYEGAARPVADDRVRSHDGPESSDLGGYRARYAQYLADPDLRAARASCPWFTIWDDHEVENNYAALEPHDPAERTTFAVRRAAAYQAWWEHMPVRMEPPTEGRPVVVHRSAAYGDLVELVLLDGRQFRSDQACGGAELSTEPPCPEALDPSRTMLGPDQEAWLAGTLAASRARWTVLGQQTVLTDLRLANGAILNHDQWDGYAAARDRLLEAAAPVAGRLVVLTGDIHLAGVGRLPGVGTEFVTTSVSSSGDLPAALQPVLASFPTIVDAELVHRGYTRHTITADSWTAEYRIVADVRDPSSAVTTWRTFTLAAGASDSVTAA